MKVFRSTLPCLAAFQIAGLAAFIIPDELPSILSVIYSNIPTLKKGTDSRIGWGFRLGDRADFQVLTELGPQINTQPLANQGDNNNKREALNSLSNVLYAQRQQDQKEEEKKASSDTKGKGEKWLETWSETVRSEQENETRQFQPKPGLGVGEIDAKSVIPSDYELERIEKLKVKLKEMLKDVEVTQASVDKGQTSG
ncbi:uncharacterized protein LOC132706042 isoform X2 [Cylas formicarius]|uniref:uncharacterized protein LOC132706042 isoform X2 n=1 Tax=Cylas formicarius TaxID=197179 RepID=UPI002958A8F8|nr:uncharacterized protein LOC132706042 isoform X2 [Cylas formicarius]